LKQKFLGQSSAASSDRSGQETALALTVKQPYKISFPKQGNGKFQKRNKNNVCDKIM
jgi:hypothetical protein